MTSATVIEQRKAQAIEHALAVLEESSPASEALREVRSEPVLQPDYALPALVDELVERVVRLERALDHVVTHVLPGDIATLTHRIEKIEASEGKGKKK